MKPHQAAALCSALAATMLAPMVAHATWRPLATGLGGPIDGVAVGVSLAALAVAAAASAAAGWAARGGSRPIAWGAGAALAAATGAAVAGGPGAVSLVGVALAAMAATPRMATTIAQTWARLGGAPSGRWLGAWVALALGCVAASVNIATYLGDPMAEGFGAGQGTVLYRHFCASAYRHAAELVTAGVADVYDTALVPPTDSDVLPATAAHMAPFTLDRYGYPPQFLLAPLATARLIDDFAAWRSMWTCANSLLFAGVLWRVGFWVGPRSGRVLRFLAPSFWMLGGVVYQSGNVQLTVFGLGLLAMLAFHQRRARGGGLLLAAVSLAKIAPGLLGVLLLVRGRWRGVAWTVAWAAALTAVTLAVTGPDVFVAFLDVHLPAVSSGLAYDFLDDTPRLIFENLSPFSLPFKLAALGVDWDPWLWGRRFAHAYTALAFALAAVAGRRTLDRRGHVAVWMVILTVAALRSPMAPGYLLAGAQLGLALVAAEARSLKAWILTGAAFLAMMMTTPMAPHSLWNALAGQAVLHSLLVWLVLRRWPVLDDPHPARPLGEDAALAES